MNSPLTHLREHYPKHWAIRLMLGTAVLGLMLGSASVSQIHKHADSDPGHSHVQMIGDEQNGDTTVPDDSTSGALHVHDSASSPLIFGSISNFDGAQDPASDWLASEDLSPPPPSSHSTPHRPPIA